jgi:hypothetical protein
MRKFGMFSAWLVATLFVTGLTWQIVSAAESQVSDGPASAVSLTDAFDSLDSSTTTSSSTTGDDIGSIPSTVPFGVSTTLPGGSPSTTSPGSGTNPGGGTRGSSPSTPISSPSTSSPASSITISAGVWKTTTVPTIGGTVIVSHRGDEVKLNTASPAPGFGMEVDKAGPPEVRIEFDGVAVTVEVRIRSENGVLDIEIREDS